MPARFLRQHDNAANDERRDYRRSDRAAQVEPAMADRLVEEIADGRAQRTRQDESGPEQQSRATDLVQ